jgi:hypothetical protein
MFSKLFSAGGGPLQMLLTLTLNFLPARANIRPLLEKAKKLTICIGNSAPLRTFFLKNLEKFDYRFFRKQKLSYLAGMSPYISLKIKKRHYEHHMIEAHK